MLSLLTRAPSWAAPRTVPLARAEAWPLGSAWPEMTKVMSLPLLLRVVAMACLPGPGGTRRDRHDAPLRRRCVAAC